MKNKLAQVWVETVIYTLIGLAVIGLLLGASKPKIDAMKDKILIEQTIDSLNQINQRIYEVQIAPGNKRVLDLKISKGDFYVNSSAKEIGWILDSNYKYSELDTIVNLGNLKVLTKQGEPYNIRLYLNYTFNLTYNGETQYHTEQGSPSPYILTIENRGAPTAGGLTNIDLVLS